MQPQERQDLIAEVMLAALREVPVLGKVVDFADNLKRRRESLKIKSRVDYIEEDMKDVKEMMKTVIDILRRPDNSEEILAHLKRLQALQEQGLYPVIYEGLFNNFPNWEPLNLLSGHWGRVLDDHDTIDPSQLQLFIDHDKPCIVELPLASMAHLFTTQINYLPRAVITGSNDVWAKKLDVSGLSIVMCIQNPNRNRICRRKYNGHDLWVMDKHPRGGPFYPQTAQLLNNGHVLVSARNKDHGIYEIDPLHPFKVLREITTPQTIGGVKSAKRTGDGKTLVTLRHPARGVLLLDSNNELIWKRGESPAGWATTTSRDTFLVSYQSSANNKVVELDRDGNTIWEFSDGLINPNQVEELADGTILVADDEANALVGIDRMGFINRRISFSKIMGRPAHFVELPNRNLVVSLLSSRNTDGMPFGPGLIVEMDQYGNNVHTWHDGGQPLSVTVV